MGLRVYQSLWATELRRPGAPERPVKERFDRLEEQLAIVTGLWETAPGAKFSYAGVYYQVTDSPALPKPVQRPRPPIIVGGHGPRRTPALAARYADEFNIAFSNVDVVAPQFAKRLPSHPPSAAALEDALEHAAASPTTNPHVAKAPIALTLVMLISFMIDNSFGLSSRS